MRGRRVSDRLAAVASAADGDDAPGRSAALAGQRPGNGDPGPATSPGASRSVIAPPSAPPAGTVDGKVRAAQPRRAPQSTRNAKRGGTDRSARPRASSRGEAAADEVRQHVRLSASTHEWLRELAYVERVPLAALIRAALDLVRADHELTDAMVDEAIDEKGAQRSR